MSKRKNYRTVYEGYHGPIPVDADGRSYDIHHLDGNYENNDISNLTAVSLEEHYAIHKSQNDWGACFAIKLRMKAGPGELSKLATKSNQQRVKNKTHHLLGGNQQRALWEKRRAEGTDAYTGDREVARQAALAQTAAGKNKLVGGEVQRKSNAERIKNKTHHLLGSGHNKKRLENGNHPSQTKVLCLECRMVMAAGGLSQHIGGEKCQKLKFKLAK